MFLRQANATFSYKNHRNLDEHNPPMRGNFVEETRVNIFKNTAFYVFAIIDCRLLHKVNCK